MNSDPVYLRAKNLLEMHLEEVKKIQPLRLSWWNQLILKLSAQNPSFQKQLFKFVDLYPTIKDLSNTSSGNKYKLGSKKISKYLEEYLKDEDSLTHDFIKLLSSLPFSDTIIESAADFGIKTMAENFILDKNEQKLEKKIIELKAKHLDFTLDILGEMVLSEEESELYLNEYIELLKSRPQINISVKLSSLCPQIKSRAHESIKEILKKRLAKIFNAAISNNSEVTIDSEHYETKNLFFDTIKELLLTDEFKSWPGAGIVIQAYLKDSHRDLISFIELSQKRKVPIKIRLVKGAYWDYERAIALQNNWSIPVYESKAATDKNYEELMELIFKNLKYIYPAIASHNLRSVALAMELAKRYHVRKSSFEFQFLYGMLDHIKTFLSEQEYQVRVYIPYGDLIQGMAYLVRRLLENTANNSFLFQSINEENLEKLIQKPCIRRTEATLEEVSKKFTNNPPLNFSKLKDRFEINFAIEQLMKQITVRPLDAYSIISSKAIDSKNISKSIIPFNKQKTLAYAHTAEINDVDRAVRKSQESFKWWSQTDIYDRVKVIKSLAKFLERKKCEYTAILCLEIAKNWDEANAEISEAIDFLYYYAEQAEELFHTNKIRSLPGEQNTNVYKALGVTAIISPWNFPLAILLGMSSAALLAGNTIIIKPSEEAPYIAYKIVSDLNKILNESFSKQNSDSVVQLLLGSGPEIGSELVQHPEVKLITFTGSKDVGMQINTNIHQNPNIKKKLIAEMGGKNAIIVDETADLDLAIPAILRSAFSFSGQKCSACSRLIIQSSIYDRFRERLITAMKSIKIKPAYLADSDISSLINAKAQEKFKHYINLAKESGAKIHSFENTLGDDSSYTVSPTLIEKISINHPTAQDEIFAPVVCLFSTEDFESAINIANSNQYGLTGAIFSRSPENIKYAKKYFDVGNLYINQACTGAIVSRQAFGGTKLSSLGYKAGGPNYLLQFVEEKNITENTMRHGMII